MKIFKIVRYFLMVCLYINAALGGANRDSVLTWSSLFDADCQVINDSLKTIKFRDMRDKLKAGIWYEFLGVKMEDCEASHKGVELLEDYVKYDNDALVLAYLGMGYALIANCEKNPFYKTLFSNKSIKIFHKAVKVSPDDWYIRFLRGRVLFEFPEFFNVEEVVKKDFAYLEKRVKELPPGVRVSLYYYRGEIEKQKGRILKAMEYWENAVELAEEKGLENIEEYRKSKKRLRLFRD